MKKIDIEFDELDELPHLWEWAPLEELIGYPKQDIVDGPFGSNLKASEYTRAGVPIGRLQNIDRNKFVHKNIKFITQEKAESLERHNFKSGDILVTKLGDPLGKACIVPESIKHGVIVADLVRIRVDQSYVSIRYLTYALNSPFLVKQFAKHTKGTTRPRVNLGVVRKLPIPLAPLVLQKRIVTEIEKQFSRLDKAVINLQRVKANLSRYKAAVLKAAVEGKLTEEWRKQNPNIEPASKLLKRILAERRTKWEEAELAKMKAQGKVPKDDKWKTKYKSPTPIDSGLTTILPAKWAWARMDDLGFIQLGRQRAPRYHAGNNMRPYLRVKNVFEDRIDLSDVMEMDFPSEDYRKYKLEPGDILLNEGQSPEFLGRPAIFKGEHPDICFTNTLIRFRVFAPLDPEYPLLVFRAYMRSGRFTQEGTITTNIAHLSAGRFAGIEFPLPPLDEQKTIDKEVARLLTGIEATDRAIEKGIKKANRLRQSILQKAFSGELVHAEPTDEPASMLLERIKKTTTPTKRKKPQS